MIEPRLYIIMCEDVPDMNPGKGMAQAAHAQARFDLYDHGQNGCLEEYSRWRGGCGFGVTTVVTLPLSELGQVVERVRHSGRVVDTTYPYKNYYGKRFFSTYLTAMWVFAITEDELEYMKTLPLHP